MQSMLRQDRFGRSDARLGVEVGSSFDKNSSLPMSLYSVSLNGSAK
jgi:hypothetical protein